MCVRSGFSRYLTHDVGIFTFVGKLFAHEVWIVVARELHALI